MDDQIQQPKIQPTPPALDLESVPAQPTSSGAKVLRHSESFSYGVKSASPLPKPARKTLAPLPLANTPAAAAIPGTQHPLIPAYQPPIRLASPVPPGGRPVTTRSILLAVLVSVIIILVVLLALGHSSGAKTGSTKGSSNTQTSAASTGTSDNPSGQAGQTPTTTAGANKQIQGDVNYCTSDPLLNC
jgi:hypothetical protein